MCPKLEFKLFGSRDCLGLPIIESAATYTMPDT